MLADDQVEVGVIGHAVAFVGRTADLADAVLRIPSPPDIARHIREQEILPSGVPDRPLGENESAGHGPDRLVLVHQGLEFRRHHAVGHGSPPGLLVSLSTLTGSSAGCPEQLLEEGRFVPSRIRPAGGWGARIRRHNFRMSKIAREIKNAKGFGRSCGTAKSHRQAEQDASRRRQLSLPPCGTANFECFRNSRGYCLRPAMSFPGR